MKKVKKGGEQFSGNLGLLISILGMAIGTGNIWRFPREVASNNGGVFVILCLLAICVWAVPLICLESAIGKKTRMANAGSFKVLLGEKYTWLGAFCAMVCIMCGCYYTTVVGWITKYLLIILTGFIGDIRAGGVDFALQYFNNFAMKPPSYESWCWFVVGIAMAGFIVYNGVEKGIERANKLLIPLVFLIFIVLLIRIVMLPNAWKGFEYMFHVDPHDFLNPRIWLAAFTQAAWSSGAGWGIYHVYYVYAQKDDDVALNSFTVAFGDMAAALLAGLVIIPAVFALSSDPIAVMKSGANGLTFVHLTNLFAHTAGGFVLAVLFFLALFSAGLSTFISMLEVAVRNLIDMGFSRTRATLCVATFFLVVGTWSALDNRVFENQDMVWGVCLLASGLIYSQMAVKYGLDRLWNEDIAPYAEMNSKWMLSLIKFIPLEFLFVWGWWMIDAASWYPGEWFKFWPITKYQYTPGSMVVEWAILLVVCLSLNKIIAKRLVHSNKID